MHVLRCLCLLLLLSFGAPFARSQTSAGSEAEKQITSTLHNMYEAEKRRDLDFVLAHLAPDFAEVAGDGLIYHRDDIEREWTNVALHNYSLADCVFKMLGGDVAYLSCRMTVDAVYKGQPFPALFRVTTVWTQSKDGWVISFEQGTVIPEEKK